MFSWINKQGVRSDRGYEFQFTGRFTAEYREHGKSTAIYVEGSDDSITIYENSLSPLWESKKSDFEAAQERRRIVSNIRDAIEFQGMRLNLAPGDEPDY